MDAAPTVIYTLSYTTLFRSAIQSDHPRPLSPSQRRRRNPQSRRHQPPPAHILGINAAQRSLPPHPASGDRKSTRLNSSHGYISYAVFCLKKKTPTTTISDHT